MEDSSPKTPQSDHAKLWRSVSPEKSAATTRWPAAGTGAGVLSFMPLPPSPLRNWSGDNGFADIHRDLIINSSFVQSGDEKYWAQIQGCYQLLMDSLGSELALAEAMRNCRGMLEPILRDAVGAQELDRLSAVAMLELLRELVAQADVASAASHISLVSGPSIMAPDTHGKRHRGDELDQMEDIEPVVAMASAEDTAAPQTPRRVHYQPQVLSPGPFRSRFSSPVGASAPCTPPLRPRRPVQSPGLQQTPPPVLRQVLDETDFDSWATKRSRQARDVPDVL